jgi:hypothetical protein
MASFNHMPVSGVVTGAELDMTDRAPFRVVDIHDLVTL